MWYYWLFIIIILAIIELSTTNLITIWYIISAFLALVLSFFIDSAIILFSVFVLVGTILLITTKPILEKKLKINKEKTNLDRVVGMKGIVTEALDKNKPGEVLVDGKRWTAISNEQLQKEEEIEVLEIQGVKLIVRKVGE